MEIMGLTEWSVSIEGRGPMDRVYDEERDAEALLEALVDLDPACGPTAYVDVERRIVAVTLAVEAESVEAALAVASSSFKAATREVFGEDIGVVSVEAKTAEEADRELAEVPGHLDLAGTKEIAEMLNVSKQRASELSRHEKFPRPVAHLAVGRIWLRRSIGHFLEEWERKPGRPSKVEVSVGHPEEPTRPDEADTVSWIAEGVASLDDSLVVASGERPGEFTGGFGTGSWSAAGGIGSTWMSWDEERWPELLKSRAETVKSAAHALIRRAERQREELQEVFEAWQGVHASLFEPSLFGTQDEEVGVFGNKHDDIPRDWIRAYTRLIDVPLSHSRTVNDVVEEVADRLARVKVGDTKWEETDQKDYESAGIRLALDHSRDERRSLKIGGNVMASQSQFEAFSKDIEPSTSTKSNAKAAHEALRAYLKGHEEFKEVLVKVLLSGSYRRNTAVRPTKKGKVTDRPDVDVLVVMDYGLGMAPGEVLDFLYRVLKPEYPEIRKQTRSIGIESNLADMDVVPIIAPHGMDGTLYIPDRKLEQWRETNPPGHTEWTTERNNASGGRFKPLVKEFKWWRRQNRTVGKKPKGFVMECIVAENMDYGQTNHAELFVGTMESIVNKYAFSIFTNQVPFIADPGVPGNSVTYGMSFDSFEGFYNKAKAHAELGRRAIEEDDPEKELDLWRKIFGPRFPAPAAAKKSQDLLSEPIAGSGALTFPDRPVEPQKRAGFA